VSTLRNPVSLGRDGGIVDIDGDTGEIAGPPGVWRPPRPEWLVPESASDSGSVIAHNGGHRDQNRAVRSTPR